MDMGAYHEAAKYYRQVNKVLVKYSHIPSFQFLHKKCNEYVVEVTAKLKQRLRDANVPPPPPLFLYFFRIYFLKTPTRDVADIVQILLNLISNAEELRVLFMLGYDTNMNFSNFNV